MDEPTMNFESAPSDGWYCQQGENVLSLAEAGSEILRIAPDGSIFVRGKPAESDAEIVAALRECARCMISKPSQTA